jgi:hypothetical protein
MNTLCEDCGGVAPLRDGTTCSRCGCLQFVLETDPGDKTITGYAIALTVANERLLGAPDVDANSVSESARPASLTADGSFQAALDACLDAGLAGEPRFLTVLVHALHARDHQVHAGSPAKARSDDSLLILEGRRDSIQMVIIPVRSATSQQTGIGGEASSGGSLQTAAALIHEALQRNSIKAVGALVTLDAARIGTEVNRALVEAYLARHGDPVTAFGLAAVWIAGSTAGSTLRVGIDERARS